MPGAFFEQLFHAPKDFFTDDLLKNNLMGNCAVDLLEIANDENATKRMRKRGEKLRMQNGCLTVITIAS